MAIYSKSTPISNKMWQMIEMILTGNQTRSEMIKALGISRGTFYRWLGDLRVQGIFREFEKAALGRITTEFQKRWQERIKLTCNGPKRELIYSPRLEKEFGDLNESFKEVKKEGSGPFNIEEIT